MASAPISASKPSPYCSRALRKSSSVSSCRSLSGASHRFDDDVVLEVDDLFQAGGFHVQQGTQAAGHGLEEPDVHDRGGQLDVAHAFASDAAMGHLDAAAIADHALVFHAAVLAAGALPVLFRPEDAFAKQTVFFRPIGPVIDRFGLFDLAEGPGTNIVRTGQADPHRPIVIDPVIGGFTGSGHVVPSIREVMGDGSCGAGFQPAWSFSAGWKPAPQDPSPITAS